ncbi:SpoIVB peptidase [Lactonifactor sp. BIOML-A3]|uniref:SpoIVB peptidase n=1 Tax=Lactonifactor sp. BIOML-A7 TaxID=2584660 RepID=UPI0012B153B8|nr:SpoIVB peptidase [Lactonifactor sp. BIOML-A7]MSA01323.1 SpoIVB peptidase [Lactonifactor sp. BIOML-A5]MSA07303.1 SpoIVB peptidase [Lactonifactor sp. BIOML-A4]MSA12033.1 SpoIVB peptidase [Lactonifactor sp. BIOML-A3]MSA16473.1 SpoIVB peptidase [Lactonifactor sp. BIOML-A2]MSA37284.1 SpoIVB peptidase [Lactonifactor sp. BIOML-A1]MSB13115.1 SpoIVB peptidase [Lactonifactor sp. BIOML-A6]
MVYLFLFLKGCDILHRKRNYRRFLLVLLLLNIIGIGVYSYISIRDSIPDDVRIRAEEQDGLASILEQNPLITYDDSLSVAGNKTYTIECRLCHVMPLKKVKVQIVEDTWVAASGTPIGLYMETEGVMIIGSGDVVSTDGIAYQPAEHIVQAGDYILKANGTDITNKNQLISMINDSNGETMELLVDRNGEEIPLSLTPLLGEDNSYKLGIWVRDNTQGIGTLTYVDAHGNYGALGHGISDVDTGELLKLERGELYQAEILSVMKGSKGNPGELSGVINYQKSNQLGSIDINSEKGIFGTIPAESRESLHLVPMEVGLKQDVTTGSAKILTTVKGETKEFDIEITEIFWDQADTNKAFSIQVTDPELLEYSGGIVQGMSGSPVIQNGKIIGAVTHVFVQDATKGYGIFIENMLG